MPHTPRDPMEPARRSPHLRHERHNQGALDGGPARLEQPGDALEGWVAAEPPNVEKDLSLDALGRIERNQHTL